MCDFNKSAVTLVPSSTVILFVLSLTIKVTITFFASVLGVALSGTVVSEITLLLASVKTTLLPAIATLFVVFEVLVTVNSVR